MDPVTAAVSRAAARHGALLTDRAARDIAAAALGAHDQTATVRRAFWKEIWDQHEYRERMRRIMRRDLMMLVADAGAIPVEQPVETLTHAHRSEFQVEGDLAVTLSMRVRAAGPAPE